MLYVYKVMGRMKKDGKMWKNCFQALPPLLDKVENEMFSTFFVLKGILEKGVHYHLITLNSEISNEKGNDY